LIQESGAFPLDMIQNLLKSNSYWTLWISRGSAHQATPLHEATAPEAGAHGLACPLL
jgi:hypothetical protein